MQRIGVFVCHCGSNIAATVDVKKVVEVIANEPGVVHAEDYQYMCSQAGQDMIINAVKEHRLTGIVVCSCSPRMHEATFRKTAQQAGINPYMVEIANIREQCSWIHKNMEEGTEKAVILARAAIANPPVLVLDEATSSIDTRTEQIVQSGMDKLMEGRTVFVIAHRLSTVMNSDVIMVLDHGKIIERGSHEKLIAEKGQYYRLYTGAFELE